MTDDEQLKVIDSILEVLNVMNTIIQEGDSNWNKFLSAQMKQLNTTVEHMRPGEISSDMVLKLRAITGEPARMHLFVHVAIYSRQGTTCDDEQLRQTPDC